MNHYILKTLGCKANLYDSQLIESELQKRGWEPQDGSSPKQVQLCIVNSCTVTDEADRQSRKLAVRMARENPEAAVLVTGCSAEVDPEGLAANPNIHFIVGNQNKNHLVEWVFKKLQEKEALRSTYPSFLTSDIHNNKILGSTKNYSQILSKHPLDREWPAASESFFTPPVKLNGNSSKTRSFLKIQEGCDSFCTFCIIPYGRGPSRSLRPLEIIQQIRQLVESGIREVILTGTNIGDYGRDWASEPELGNLIEMILAETKLERLRVSSLDPTEITLQIFSLMKQNSRFCPHFHVSLQSPHDRILRLMKRRYGFAEVKKCLDTIFFHSSTTPLLGGIFVGMDLITGFPGETDEEFEWTYKALSSLPWTRLHVFPYSERKGTPATRLPQAVPQQIRVQRAHRLAQLSLNRLTQHYQSVLQTCNANPINLDSVLMEKSDTNWVPGFTPNYLRILLNGKDSIERNQLISVRPLEVMTDQKGSDVALVSVPVT